VSPARRLNHCNNTELIAGGILKELDIFSGCVCHEPDWVTPDPALDFATAATVDVVGEWWERKRRREKNGKWERTASLLEGQNRVLKLLLKSTLKNTSKHQIHHFCKN
jgi:hypothetical protein